MDDRLGDIIDGDVLIEGDRNAAVGCNRVRIMRAGNYTYTPAPQGERVT